MCKLVVRLFQLDKMKTAESALKNLNLFCLSLLVLLLRALEVLVDL
jgi:hypothetical protein